MCKAECKDEVTSLGLCMMKEKCFEDVSLLEHLVVGSEAFEETKIHAYESPGNPQHVGMMASKKHQSSKTMSKKLKHKNLIRKRKLSKCTPSDKLKTSGIIRSPIPFKKTNQSACLALRTPWKTMTRLGGEPRCWMLMLYTLLVSAAHFPPQRQ